MSDDPYVANAGVFLEALEAQWDAEEFETLMLGGDSEPVSLAEPPMPDNLSSAERVTWALRQAPRHQKELTRLKDEAAARTDRCTALAARMLLWRTRGELDALERLRLERYVEPLRARYPRVEERAVMVDGGW
jgi:hypothetical protein